MSPSVGVTDLLRNLSADLASIGSQSPGDLADQIGTIALTLNYVADALDHEFALAAERGRKLSERQPMEQ